MYGRISRLGFMSKQWTLLGSFCPPPTPSFPLPQESATLGCEYKPQPEAHLTGGKGGVWALWYRPTWKPLSIRIRGSGRIAPLVPPLAPPRVLLLMLGRTTDTLRSKVTVPPPPSCLPLSGNAPILPDAAVPLPPGASCGFLLAAASGWGRLTESWEETRTTPTCAYGPSAEKSGEFDCSGLLVPASSSGRRFCAPVATGVSEMDDMKYR